MILADIIAKYPIINIEGDINIEISGIQHNSKRIKEGNLFIAQKGYNHDGHNYIEDAIRNGAIAIVKEKNMNLSENITSIDVHDATDALGYFTSKFYHQPWASLNTIGITGTNGKTITSYLIKHILEIKKEKVGIIGTMGVLIDKQHIDIPNTTPDSLEIQRYIHQMVEEGVTSIIMEVSSHALDMKRVKYMDFDLAIFTNLSEDHLDFHGTMERYFYSKLRLFLKSNRINIINNDDTYGKRIIEQISEKSEILRYGLDDADIFASDIVYINGMPNFKLSTPEGSVSIQLKVPGQFNIYNSLAATGCCIGLGLSLDIIKEGLESFRGVRGRLEQIETKMDFKIFIDFAHTPEGMKEALQAIDKIAEGRKVIVFGAGGDRDKSKRPMMGKIAGEYSDLVIITSDNPRSEEPQDIANDIVQGVRQTNTNYRVILDRKEAINYAIINSICNDTILIAGKGHEDTMTIKGKKISFDERKIILDIIDKSLIT